MEGGFVDKRAQIGIIVVVLLILIVLVGIVIVWNVVGGLVSERSKDIEGSLLNIRLEVEDVVIFVTGASKISVSRKVGGGKIDGLKVVFYDIDGNSEVKTINEGLDELETKRFNFNPIGISGIERVSVYPVKEGNIGREFKSGVGDIIEVPSGMVSWWRFDGLEDFVDGNDGEIVGGVGVDGKLVLNGGYFSVSDSDSLDLSDGVTISAWVNGDNDGVIVGKGKNYKVFLRDGKVVFSYDDEEFESIERVGEGWNHIVISADFNGVFKIFVNGVLSNSGILKAGVVNSDDLRIGEGFVGEVDEVIVFDRGLGVEQIEGLYGFGRE